MTVGRRAGAWAFAVLAIGAAACGGGDDSTSAGEGAGAGEGGQPGVASVTETFVDETRPTEAEEGVTEAEDTRTIPTTIWYPEGDEGPYPLVIFSHGVTAHAADYEPEISEIAAAGYVVAGPDFPETTGGDGIDAFEFVVHQPADVSFVIDQVLALDAGSEGPLAGLVDEERIGVAGHSLGGITTFGVAYNSCCRDDRIDAASPWAGLLLPYGEGTAYDLSGVPMLLIHGDLDDTVPYRGSTQAFEQATAPRYLLTVLEADHGSYLDPDDDANAVVVGATIDFLDGYLLGDDAALERLPEDAVLDGVTTLESAPG